MRSRWLAPALALAISTTAAPAPGLPDGFEDPAARTRITRLENGLTVLTLEDHATPVVSFQVWVKAGSRDETRYTGVAHLFEHMMFRGTEHLEPQQFTRLVEARGGELNAFTSNDVTVYFDNVTAESLPLVIDLEAERFANLVLDDSILQTEREVVLEERRMRVENSPEGLGFEALLALAFTAHPYRWPVIGWRSDVEAVSVQACRDFFSTYYAPNNLVVALAGDFETETALERIRLRFGAMPPAAEVPRNPTREPEQRGERVARVHYDVRGPILLSAWHAPPTGHPDGPALDVMSGILSDGRSSRLYRRLVNDEQVALSADGGYWELQDAGLFYGHVLVRPDADRARAEALFLEELARMRDEPVRPEELEKARRKLEVALVSGLSTAHALASRVARDWVAFGRIRPLDELLARIEAVSAEDVQRVARQYLRADGRSTIEVIAPPEQAAP